MRASSQSTVCPIEPEQLNEHRLGCRDRALACSWRANRASERNRAGAAGEDEHGDFAPRATRHRVAVSPRFAYRLGAAAEEVGAHVGFGVGGTYEYIYATAASRLELALGTDFSLDRFGSAEKGTLTEGGVVTTYDATRVILENAFLLVHTAAANLGPARPFVTIGAGLGVGNVQTVSPSFATTTSSSTSFHDLQFLARVSAGLDVVVTRVWRASLRLDYTAVRLADRIPTVSGATLPAFVDLLDVSLGLVYRF